MRTFLAFILLLLTPAAAFSAADTIGVMALTNGVLKTPTNFLNSNIFGAGGIAVHRTSNGANLGGVTVSNDFSSVAWVNGVSNLITVFGGGGGSATNAVSSIWTNGVPVVTGVTNLDLVTGSGLLNRTTNSSGRVTHQWLIDWTQTASQTNLNAASNALLSAAQTYANSVTNSTIVRQAELTASSNVLNSALVANDTTTSNGVLTAAGVYTDSRSVAASNLSYAIGGALTNYVKAEGASSSNYTDARAVALSNLSYAVGASLTNYTDARAVALSNLSYALGTAGTNYANSVTNSPLGTNWINFRQIASVYLSNLVAAANGTGMLTNNGAGVLGWMTIPSGGGGVGIIPGVSNVAYSTNLFLDFSQTNYPLISITNTLVNHINLLPTNLLAGSFITLRIKGTNVATNFSVYITWPPANGVVAEYLVFTNGGITTTCTSNKVQVWDFLAWDTNRLTVGFKEQP